MGSIHYVRTHLITVAFFTLFTDTTSAIRRMMSPIEDVSIGLWTGQAMLLPRGGEGESSARSPPFPRGYLWFFGLLGGGPPLYRLFVLSERACERACERASVFTFFGATTSQRPSYLIKTPHHHHHHHHNTTEEEEDRADNTPSPPPLAALFVVGGGGGGRRREKKKKRKNILYCMHAMPSSA